MARDPFFADLQAQGWHVPFRQRIAYRDIGTPDVPVHAKIRGHGSRGEWQLDGGWRSERGYPPYHSAETLPAALA
jgi:hypothetical protein